MRILPACIMLLLLLLPALPAAAQERCVSNPPALSPGEKTQLATLRQYLAEGFISPEELARLRLLEAKTWPRAVAVGNGWIAEGRDSCILYISGSGEPVLGTRIYWFGATDSGEAATGSGQSARVISGPARIRSGPGLEHAQVQLCGYNWMLTVWTPAVDGWLRASCYGARGWIHQSLVSIAGAAPVAVSLPAAPTTEAVPAAEAAPAAVSLPVTGSGQQAMVISGPANIRSGPGREHASVAWCGINWMLTVWTPAQNGWLPASCHGANGWIHESLVSIGG